MHSDAEDGQVAVEEKPAEDAERERDLTAIHEAGHAVACVRLGLQVGVVSIRPGTGTLGHCAGDDDGECCAKGAEAAVLMGCAGYAAGIAAGFDHAVAARCCASDFDEAEQQIAFWFPAQPLSEWLERACGLMKQPENVKAVALLAKYLMDLETIDGQAVEVLVDLADGQCTEAEAHRYLAWISAASK